VDGQEIRVDLDVDLDDDNDHDVRTHLFVSCMYLMYGYVIRMEKKGVMMMTMTMLIK
jgi:hypothetical protein